MIVDVGIAALREASTEGHGMASARSAQSEYTAGQLLPAGVTFVSASHGGYVRRRHEHGDVDGLRRDGGDRVALQRWRHPTAHRDGDLPGVDGARRRAVRHRRRDHVQRRRHLPRRYREVDRAGDPPAPAQCL